MCGNFYYDSSTVFLCVAQHVESIAGDDGQITSVGGLEILADNSHLLWREDEIRNLFCDN